MNYVERFRSAFDRVSVSAGMDTVRDEKHIRDSKGQIEILHDQMLEQVRYMSPDKRQM
jgi:hypothetical protein